MNTDEVRRQVILCLLVCIGDNKRTAAEILRDSRGVVLPYDFRFLFEQATGVGVDHPAAMHTWLNSLVGEVAGLRLLRDGRRFHVEGPGR